MNRKVTDRSWLKLTVFENLALAASWLYVGLTSCPRGLADRKGPELALAPMGRCIMPYCHVIAVSPHHSERIALPSGYKNSACGVFASEHSLSPSSSPSWPNSRFDERHIWLVQGSEFVFQVDQSILVGSVTQPVTQAENSSRRLVKWPKESLVDQFLPG